MHVDIGVVMHFFVVNKAIIVGYKCLVVGKVTIWPRHVGFFVHEISHHHRG